MRTTLHDVGLVYFALFFLQGGTTLLMIATDNGLTEVVSLLLNYGAGIDIRNKVWPSNATFLPVSMCKIIAEWFHGTNVCL